MMQSNQAHDLEEQIIQDNVELLNEVMPKIIKASNRNRPGGIAGNENVGLVEAHADCREEVEIILAEKRRKT